MEDKEDTQDWEEFVREIKTIFSNKSKIADAKWKIKIFKQDKKHIANFMIKFKALAMKAKINDIHTIFLLKKNIRIDIIKNNIGISTNSSIRDTERVKGSNHISWLRV